MEYRFQNRLQVSLDHRYGNSVGDHGYTQWPRSSLALRYIHPAHRRREVTARAHPIPDSIEVATQVLFKLRNRLVVNSRCAVVRLNLLVCHPHFPFGNTKRLCLTHASPPLAGCPRNKAGRRRPFGPVPLQNLQPYCERLRPCAPHRYALPCGGSRLGVLPSHRDDRFPRSSSKPDSRSRHLHAGRQPGSKQISPSPNPGGVLRPGFDVI
jgi:hypothetical protein